MSYRPIYVNDIQNCAPDSCIKLFADNTNIFVTGKSLEETINKANNSLLLPVSYTHLTLPTNREV